MWFNCLLIRILIIRAIGVYSLRHGCSDSWYDKRNWNTLDSCAFPTNQGIIYVLLMFSTLWGKHEHKAKVSMYVKIVLFSFDFLAVDEWFVSCNITAKPRDLFSVCQHQRITYTECNYICLFKLQIFSILLQLSIKSKAKQSKRKQNQSKKKAKSLFLLLKKEKKKTAMWNTFEMWITPFHCLEN